MSVARFLIIVIIFCFFGILFVWQQTQIFQLGYENQMKIKYLEELLDEKKLLSYNLDELSSINNISKIKDHSLNFPERFQLVRLPLADNDQGNNPIIEEKESDASLGIRLLWPLAWAEEFLNNKTKNLRPTK